jgi:hypothetical protein
MSQATAYVDTSEVRPGRLEELKVAMKDLARFVQANEAAAVGLQRVLQ